MPLKVIYIDDEIGMCQMFEDNFASDAIEIRSFTAPEPALAAMQSDPADLLIVDYHLDHMTADELAMHIPSRIPMALITGELSLKPSQRFVKVFRKPFNFSEMAAFLDEYLKSKQSA